MLISLESIHKAHNEKCILKDVSFSIEEKVKIALIGVNGTGKTTFLRILAGLEPYVQGSIIRKKDLKIAYLPQEPILHEEYCILDQVLNHIDQTQEATKEYEAKAMLGKLGIQDVTQPIRNLSGGQKKRVALAEVLLQPCDLLLLDEPTNHLDADMIEWLEKYLIKYNKAVFMVTHDRYFMERITEEIVEIAQGRLYEYKGNYSTYIEEKRKREEEAILKEKKRQSILRKELEWVRAGVQARGTKSKDRLERFEKLSQVEKSKQEGTVNLSSATTRLGKKTIELRHISKGYDNQVLFEDFDYTLLRHDRIGILGPNGCGKSTLLKVLHKDIEPDHGEVIYGDTVKVGFFRQGCEELAENKRVIDVIRDISDDIETADAHYSAAQMLERFLFDRSVQYQKVSTLSGGEKRRLYLLTVLMEAPNILFLDEPTNDLDINTLQVLEDYLDGFAGALIVVSHDRYFLDRICDSMFVFTGDKKITRTIGGYSQYMELASAKDTATKQKDAKKAIEEKRQQRAMIPSLTSKEKRELETIDEDIANLETTIHSIDQSMSQAQDDFTLLTELGNKRTEIEKQLEAMTERWMELEEKRIAMEEFKKSHR